MANRTQLHRAQSSVADFSGAIERVSGNACPDQQREAVLLRTVHGHARVVRLDIAEARGDLYPVAARAAIILGSCAAFWLSLGLLIS